MIFRASVCTGILLMATLLIGCSRQKATVVWIDVDRIVMEEAAYQSRLTEKIRVASSIDSKPAAVKAVASTIQPIIIPSQNSMERRLRRAIASAAITRQNEAVKAHFQTITAEQVAMELPAIRASFNKLLAEFNEENPFYESALLHEITNRYADVLYNLELARNNLEIRKENKPSHALADEQLALIAEHKRTIWDCIHDEVDDIDHLTAENRKRIENRIKAMVAKAYQERLEVALALLEDRLTTSEIPQPNEIPPLLLSKIHNNEIKMVLSSHQFPPLHPLDISALIEFDDRRRLITREFIYQSAVSWAKSKRCILSETKKGAEDLTVVFAEDMQFKH